MANYYDVGDIVRASSTFTSTGGTKTDPTTVGFVYTTPDGTDNVFTRTGATTGTVDSVVRSTAGVYYSDITTTASGPYWYRYSSTGNITAMDEAVFRVRHKYTTT